MQPQEQQVGNRVARHPQSDRRDRERRRRGRVQIDGIAGHAVLLIADGSKG